MAKFIVIGIIQGSVIGLLALGLALVYKGSRVFNFAQAEFGSVAGFALYFLIEVVNVPYPVAALLAVAGAGLMGFVMERLVVRPLFDAPRVTLLVATAGFALLALALQLQIGGANQRNMSAALSGKGIGVLGATVRPQQFLTVLVVIGLALGLAYFFKKSDLGLAVLATSQEPVATELVGIGTKRISSFVWTFAALLGGVAGILQAGIANVITPGFMTANYLLLGFTAAILGGITSLAGAFVGGQLIGIVQQLGSYFDATYMPEGIEIPGFPDLIVFIMLLAVLLVKPRGLLGREA